MRIRRRPPLVSPPPQIPSSSNARAPESGLHPDGDLIITGGAVDSDPHPQVLLQQLPKEEKEVELDSSSSSLDAQVQNNERNAKDEMMKEKAKPMATTSGSNSTNVEGGVKKRRSPAVLMEGSRCSRVNGRGWRCSQQTLIGYSLCEHHLGKGRLRSISSVRVGEGNRKAAAKKREGAAGRARSMSSLLDDDEDADHGGLDGSVAVLQ